ncbi:MAG: DNA polymerase IV, partial [Lachnospiraceae bacterium]
MNVIFHIDVNSAYLSWSAMERLKKDPTLDLRTVPAIIGGDEHTRHGVVLAKSIPAKKYG